MARDRQGKQRPRGAAARECTIVALTMAAIPTAQAACPVSYFPQTGLEFRRSLQPALPDLGSSGFGRTQPYADGTVSMLHGTEVSLIVRMQDDLVSEIGAELPLPAEPIELAKFNALSTWSASRFTSESEKALRARLLASILSHADVGSWTETSGDLNLLYRRDPKALVVKIRKGPCG